MMSASNEIRNDGISAVNDEASYDYAQGAVIPSGAPLASLNQRSELHHGELTPHTAFEGLLGSSGPLRQLHWEINVVAPTNSTVLIEGETGSGKELVAHAIHKLSTRNARNFVR